MKLPVRLQVNDHYTFHRVRGSLTLGHYFAFPGPELDPHRGRWARLLALSSAPRRVIPLVGDPIELSGVTLVPGDRRVGPIGSVVSDRDLYRAEQDTVRLFVAVTDPSAGVKLVVTQNGEPFSATRLELDGGVAIETSSSLLPGAYEARVEVGGRELGPTARFDVAEYSLAPLSGRLLSHELDRQDGRLAFRLEVESYQLPFEGELLVSLVDEHRELGSERLAPESPGCYRGSLPLVGEGPFRLQLVSTEDTERTAQIAIPGSRAAERDVTVIGELGTERLFSMMPEPGALPMRGGFLTAGDTFATPFVVAEVVSDRFTIQAKRDATSLCLVVLDLESGELTAEEVGDVASGASVEIPTSSSFCTVFVGALVNGQPFEGYTSFVRPGRARLSLEVPERVLPTDVLTVRVELEGLGRADADSTVPVLLSVRDQRLTAAYRPAKSLGASAKTLIEEATRGMEDGLIDLSRFDIAFPMARGIPDTQPARARLTMSPRVTGGAAPELTVDEVTEIPDEMENVRFFDARDSSAVMRATLESMEPLAPSYAEAVVDEGREEEQAPEPPRAEFPDVIFYGIIRVSGSETVEIPLDGTLGTFAIEAFALRGADWTEASATVLVDKPVRVDLELPPAVHPGDRAFGKLRAITTSGRGKLRLTRDGEPLPLPDLQAGEEVATPFETEIEVVPGTYRAHVEDAEDGTTDEVERIVGEPGLFKSYVRELGLLLAGDHITLDSADALALRLLPAVEEPLSGLMQATASYEHLCCEQTAAKMLAATYMYLTSPTVAERDAAVTIMISGLKREKTMLIEGEGFAMYPGSRKANDTFGRLAVRYLWAARELDRVTDLPPKLQRFVREATALADRAAEAYRMERVPRKIGSPADAFAAAAAERTSPHWKRYFEELLDFDGDDVAVRGVSGAVERRAALAYAGAAFLAAGEIERGIRLANQVTRQLNDAGRLYSTVDSVAALVLLIQLRASGIVSGSARLRVNGKEVSVDEASMQAGHGDEVESVEVLEGIAAVEITRIQEDDWSAYRQAFPVRVGFRDERNERQGTVRVGDRTELTIALSDGYRFGDLAHVSLPPSLSWLSGGAKVKRFSVDFQGSDEVRVPLLATSRIDGEQHFAVVVRNMFEEERVTSPGPIAVRGG